MTLEEIKDKVEAAGGVSTFPMWQVRDAHGAGRLGVHVRKAITNKLKGMGVAHYPSDLPDSQDASVRLYKLGSPVAELIDAVLSPDSQGDARIRDAVSGEADTVLVAIRELVCA